jgi:hypothetical protein
LKPPNAVAAGRKKLIHAHPPIVNPLAIICEEADKECGSLLCDVVRTLAKPMTYVIYWIRRNLEEIIKNNFQNIVSRSFAPNGLLSEPLQEGLYLLCVIDVC